MAFSSNSGGGPMADINVTPLVDVMLVLLIIFMVTAPPLSHQIQVDLPQPTRNPPPNPPNPPDPIKIRIDAGGSVSMNGTPVDMKSLEVQFNTVGELPFDDQGKLEIDTDPEAEYEVLAKVLARAKNASLTKIGFVKSAEM
ncbi:MAG: biopolymer transporter ExbD [Arenimonas sp.]